MTDSEFNNWFTKHCAAFKGMESWASVELIQQWKHALSGVSYQDALRATTVMMLSAEEHPWRRHPAEIAATVRPPVASRVAEVERMAHESRRRRAELKRYLAERKRRWGQLKDAQRKRCHERALEKAGSEFERTFLKRQARKHDRPCVAVLEMDELKYPRKTPSVARSRTNDHNAGRPV